MNACIVENYSNRSYQEMLMKKFVEINKAFQKKNKGKHKSLILFHYSFKHN
jgi:hypothetical protein